MKRHKCFLDNSANHRMQPITGSSSDTLLEEKTLKKFDVAND